MSAPNWRNRTLYHGDNLDFLRGMNTGSVHLIATDPPFNKGRDFHATPDSLAAGAKFQDRWSWADDVEGAWIDQIQDDWPAVWEVIDAARATWGDDMAAFLCFMGVRLIEMHRVLRDDGSLYLHCDDAAGHYLKALLDAVFGRQQFRNEIVWQRSLAHNMKTRGFQRVNDVILYYSKTDVYCFNAVYTPYGEAQLKRYRKDESGRLYKAENLTFSTATKSRQFEWRGAKPPPNRSWGASVEQLEEWYEEGRILLKRDGTPRLDGMKTYLDEMPGKPATTNWTDIPRIGNTSNERVGYPTQKPLALYERIINASSNLGDIVLDPFAGCATTPIAAERLGRQWVAIDIWEGAADIVRQRLADNRQLLTDADPQIHYTTQPPVRTDDGGEAVPFLQVTERYAEPDGPRMSRADMYDHLLRQHGPRCQGCDRTFDDPRYLELDHNTPRSDGGLNHITNRVLLCGPCNRLKSNQFTLSGLRRQNAKLGYMAPNEARHG